jgi:hypothetical protein
MNTVTFTKISNERFLTNSETRGTVSKKYIDKVYNLPGEAVGSFTLLKKSYFTQKQLAIFY